MFLWIFLDYINCVDTYYVALQTYEVWSSYEVPFMDLNLSKNGICTSGFNQTFVFNCNHQNW